MNAPIWGALGYMGKVAIPQRVSQGQNQGRFPADSPEIIWGGQKGLVLTFPEGAPILISATKEGIEEGGCVGFGQAYFVVF